MRVDVGPKGGVEDAIRVFMNNTLAVPIAMDFSFKGRKTTRNNVTTTKRAFVDTLYCKLLEGKQKYVLIQILLFITNFLINLQLVWRIGMRSMFSRKPDRKNSSSHQKLFPTLWVTGSPRMRLLLSNGNTERRKKYKNN